MHEVTNTISRNLSGCCFSLFYFPPPFSSSNISNIAGDDDSHLFLAWSTYSTPHYLSSFDVVLSIFGGIASSFSTVGTALDWPSARAWSTRYGEFVCLRRPGPGNGVCIEAPQETSPKKPKATLLDDHRPTLVHYHICLTRLLALVVLRRKMTACSRGLDSGPCAIIVIPLQLWFHFFLSLGKLEGKAESVFESCCFSVLFFC